MQQIAAATAEIAAISWKKTSNEFLVILRIRSMHLRSCKWLYLTLL